MELLTSPEPVLMSRMPERERNFKLYEICNTRWEVPEQYDLHELVGAGTFGQVIAAKDHYTGMKVAIKKLNRPFQLEDHAKRAYREIRILKHMEHENIIGLLDIFTPSTDVPSFNDVYLVMPLMDTDLHKIIKTQPLTEGHIQFFVYQIVRALKYLHSAGIIHRDLKPGNVALNSDNDLKLLDFGLARHTQETMTGYVNTRWWRAPEIIFNWTHYDCSADMWSVACIMAELYRRRPLFRGANHIDQLEKIIDIVGSPGQDMLDQLHSETARTYVMNMKQCPKQDLRKVIPNACPQAIAFMDNLLNLNPGRRMTATQALAHPFLSSFADPSDEPEMGGYELAYENAKDFTIQQWKHHVFEEVQQFQPPRINQLSPIVETFV